MRLIVVTAKYDDDANVWYVEESNVPGLRTEAPTIEALRAKLPGSSKTSSSSTSSISMARSRSRSSPTPGPRSPSRREQL